MDNLKKSLHLKTVNSGESIPQSEPEAPVSPSAYRFFLTRQESEHLLSVAPSPPLEQDNYPDQSMKSILQSAAVKSVKRQIGSLKKQMREYEENFYSEHGYPPNMQHKMNSVYARPILLEIDKLKKSLIEFKHDADSSCDEFTSPNTVNGKTTTCSTDHHGLGNSLPISSDTSHGKDQINVNSTTGIDTQGKGANDVYLQLREQLNSSQVDFGNKPCYSVKSNSEDICISLKKQLDKLLETMAVKRAELNRPEDVTLMTAGQIVDEKGDLQEQLAQIECKFKHVQPEMYCSIMKEPYDRLRIVTSLVDRMSTSSCLSSHCSSLPASSSSSPSTLQTADSATGNSIYNEIFRGKCSTINGNINKELKGKMAGRKNHPETTKTIVRSGSENFSLSPPAPFAESEFCNFHCTSKQLMTGDLKEMPFVTCTCSGGANAISLKKPSTDFSSSSSFSSFVTGATTLKDQEKSISASDLSHVKRQQQISTLTTGEANGEK